ncbi:DUF5794 domain-containing protein [Halomicrococcus gelatinilyticus]|uniref:DUF5794 domain-containing protein n=1 Tax=Halomicrococcus gelatinilyticus TaxID=1702103 RepID=UPI002E145D57
MSSSRHPVAYRLERQVGGNTKLLATVMGLPLIDGIFPAMVLAGALDTWTGIVQVGLLVFGGSATVAVILAEMDGTPREQATSVLAVGVGLVAVAALEAAFAPTIQSVLNLAVFERFAALVIAAIAAKTASARVGEYLPSSGVIIGLGMLASLQPSGFRVVTNPDTTQVVHAVAAAGSGVAFALTVAVLSPRLREVVDVDRFRFGSAVALGVLPLTIVGPLESDAPLALAVLAVAALLALDPGDQFEVGGSDHPDADAQTVTDGGEYDDDQPSVETVGDESETTAYGYPGEDDGERRPWL